MRTTLHIQPNEQTVVNLTNIYKKTGEINKLHSLLQDIRKGYIKINMNELVYGALIDSFAKSDDDQV